ncbi:hypothetical protein GOEFS_131_00020 [Gordonia effusa NBRC 100432]|uniref:Putative restriction endonuclease domain-containing protein n=1 Tax=Gordonia effusa NBRC 100432 TaxID=1077974 RepID=H0R6R6_9ACTN|nr:Uma2 family endonuclease [Gordonia effusa]GAB20767.1 hypothetical protein GOEFS_131_00020 [Gordonia effusa NBRC 100432]
MAEPACNFPEVWTTADLDRLPNEGHRYEILEGSLVMAPPPWGHHQNIATKLLVTLFAAAPADWRVLTKIGVHVPGGEFIPDIAVLKPGAEHRVVWNEAADVALVVEVASASTQSFERGTKAQKYAAAGIPNYWRVEQDGSVVAYELDGPSYTVIATARPGTSWTATTPFTTTLTPSDLVT